MEKIPTVFKRDEKTKRVIPELALPLEALAGAVAVEKVDGMNVRLTTRNGKLVRLEARRNPSKTEKAAGIKEPWYREAWRIEVGHIDKGDEYLLDAVESLLKLLPDLDDGEWPGEAIGDKIQGNPLELTGRTCFVFSNERVRRDLHFPYVPALIFDGIDDEPITDETITDWYDELRHWLPWQTTSLGGGKPIEGIVWWLDGKPVAKLKTKDFPDA